MKLDTDVVNICNCIGCWQQLEECGQILWRKEGSARDFVL